MFLQRSVHHLNRICGGRTDFNYLKARWKVTACVVRTIKSITHFGFLGKVMNTNIIMMCGAILINETRPDTEIKFYKITVLPVLTRSS